MLTPGELSELDRQVRAVACVECVAAGKCVISPVGECPITVHLTGLVEVVSTVDSDRMDAYVERVRETICTTCRSAELVPGTCDYRDEGRCALDSMMLPIVTVIEEYLTQRKT